MRLFTVMFIFCLTQLLGSQIDPRFAKSEYCIGCHQEQGKDWKTSLHSKSHMTKNTLYMKILEHIEAKKFVYKEVQSLRCGQCHNPRMETKDADIAFSISKAYGFDTKESKKVDASLNDSTSQDGISCIICHNVASIHQSAFDSNATTSHRKAKVNTGFQALQFGPNNVMVGPFEESSRTTYHKMKQVPHFKEEVNKLCFACHHSSQNDNNIPIYGTGIEYEQSQSSEKCVECHMGKQEMAIIAPNVISSTQAIERPTRRHLFAGVRNSDIVEKSLNISLESKNGFLHIALENTTPHKVPTGFAGREIEIEILYKQNYKVLKKVTKKLNTLYLNRKGMETISYIAEELKHDNRLNSHEKREYKVENVDGATEVEVNFWYRLVKESLIDVLKIEDEVYLKKYPIFSKELKL